MGSPYTFSCCTTHSQTEAATSFNIRLCIRTPNPPEAVFRAGYCADKEKGVNIYILTIPSLYINYASVNLIHATPELHLSLILQI